MGACRGLSVMNPVITRLLRGLLRRPFGMRASIQSLPLQTILDANKSIPGGVCPSQSGCWAPESWLWLRGPPPPPPPLPERLLPLLPRGGQDGEQRASCSLRSIYADMSFLFLFKTFFIDFLQRGRERETSIDCLLNTPHWRCARNQGTLPLTGIEPGTLQSAGRRSSH
uniref:Uncharacterized protein n=1 Tax=Pipistrellus kuhlii TaxID=59472 RepID=A0A7J7XAY6_PIPKU|nr:hypothetical protein mPipKuh1_010576 [Pipistrellus kuhlii]